MLQCQSSVANRGGTFVPISSRVRILVLIPFLLLPQSLPSRWTPEDSIRFHWEFPVPLGPGLLWHGIPGTHNPSPYSKPASDSHVSAAGMELRHHLLQVHVYESLTNYLCLRPANGASLPAWTGHIGIIALLVFVKGFSRMSARSYSMWLA
jgi:hypothetical protein